MKFILLFLVCASSIAFAESGANICASLYGTSPDYINTGHRKVLVGEAKSSIWEASASLNDPRKFLALLLQFEKGGYQNPTAEMKTSMREILISAEPGFIQALKNWASQASVLQGLDNHRQLLQETENEIAKFKLAKSELFNRRAVLENEQHQALLQLKKVQTEMAEQITKMETGQDNSFLETVDAEENLKIQLEAKGTEIGKLDEKFELLNQGQSVVLAAKEFFVLM